jgi:hypothetical protein
LAAAERQLDLQGTAHSSWNEAMVPNCTTAEDILKTIKDEKVQMINLRFTDLPGVWQHFSIPPSAVKAEAIDEGIGFDGSSIRGFQEIQESDMLVELFRPGGRVLRLQRRALRTGHQLRLPRNRFQRG